MRGRKPSPPPIPDENGIVKVWGLTLNTKPECVICGGKTPKPSKIRKDMELYRLTCSDECTGELKSRNSSRSRHNKKAFLYGRKESY